LSIWIRKVTDGNSENYVRLAEESWDLPELFKIFENWLTEHADNLPSGHQWIADIGFTPREGANGGGPILSVQLMKKCTDLGMSIYLSEYNDEDDV